MADDGAGRSGFLSRWVRRKTEVLNGTLPSEPFVRPEPLPSALVPPPEVGTTRRSDPPAVVDVPDKTAEVLSLEDVQALTKDSDFKPFMAHGVGTDVRNAAMKKLFADPHFNVMDGLDTYIDDYSKSDPIPESMLRQMTSSKFLGLFSDDGEKKASSHPAHREDANDYMGETVAQSGGLVDVASVDATPPESSSQPLPLPSATGVPASQEDHAHIDLRLQPDHAASAPGAGRSTR